jgi:(heptosyl)LPS beta-1,4-glucosyltransferase
MSKISVVLITLNEEINLEKCLIAAQDVANEIIVCDSFSVDRTLSIARRYNCKIIEQKWLGYSAQKNLANEAASCEYILSLDADEMLSQELIDSILSAKQSGLSGAYEINRLTNYCGKWIKHSGWYPDKKIRLFPKNGTYWQGEFVHEELVLPSNCTIKSLKGDLLHYSYYSFKDHRARADKYSELTAQKMHAQGKKAGPLKPWLSGFARFIGMYLLKLGFLDGYMGYKIAQISARSNFYKYQCLRKLNRGEEI